MTKKQVAFALAAGTVAVLVFLLLRERGTDAVEPSVETGPMEVNSGGGIDAEPSGVALEPGVRMPDLSGVEISPTQLRVEDYDMEVELRERIRISREVFGAEGPRRCANVCDCQPGEACEGNAGICVPGLMAPHCCEWDSCPQGATCTTADGTASRCGFDEAAFVDEADTGVRGSADAGR